MRKFLSRAAAAIVAAAVALTPLAARAPVPKPALWKVADRDTTIYLFGTIHLLPSGTQWRTAKFNEAAASASSLVVETMIDEKNPQSAIGAMMQLAVSPNLPPVLDRVPADKRDAMAALIKRSAMPVAALDKLETWAVAFVLIGVGFQDLGLDPNSGVEHFLKDEFTTAKKPIDQLETNAEQFGFFDTLPEEAQREFLVSVLADPAKERAQYQDMLRVWSRGDVRAMGRAFNRELGNSPALRENLMRKRNANWSRWLQQRLAQPGVTMVAVGAGHLAGDDSVIALLKRSGYSVSRVQ
jgi:uncharacterized protein YbaP (TraB family)